MHIDPNKLYAVMKDRYSKDPTREVLGVNPGSGKLILWRPSVRTMDTTGHEDIAHVVCGVESPWSVRLRPEEAADRLSKVDLGRTIGAQAPSALQIGTCPVQGYSVQAEAGGRPTVIHPTLAFAEAEAMRLANANAGLAFYVQPLYTGKAISKASVPKPVATLEKL